MTSILFVDDEVHVLESLRDVLRRDRGRWEMTFANGGEAAVSFLVQRRFDMVICDMRMPGTDGSEVLRKARRLQPAACRVVLSGHTEHESMLRSLALTHRFLAKPCDTDELRATIESLARLLELVPDLDAREGVGRITSLPALPDVREEALAAVHDEGCRPETVASVVGRDPALVANLLRLGNSAYFGDGREVASVADAAAAIGLEGLRAAELGTALFDGDHLCGPGYPVDLVEFAAHATTVAVAVAAALPDDEAAYAAGFLHDIGTLVLAESEPDLLAAFEAEASERGCPLHVVEREARGVTHAEIGGLLLGLWGLPERIVDAVACHAAPERSTGRIAAAINLADTA
jgi:HD-like signal output (HDOD) protein